MSNCSEISKSKGIKFATGVRLSVTSPNVNTEALVSNLLSTIGKDVYDPLAIATIIQGALVIPPNKTAELVKLVDIGEIESFIKANLLVDKARLAANLNALNSLPGFSNNQDIINTLKSVSETEVTTVPGSKDTMSDNTTTVATHEVLLNTSEGVVDTLFIGEAGTELLKRKSDRMAKSKGLNESASDYWTPFLSSYFPGMSGLGAEFIEWSRNNFYSALVDTSSSKKGFIPNINSVINKIKADIESQVIVMRDTMPYNKSMLNTSIIQGSPEIKTKYFHEVLATDFDFILNNLIKSINVSKKLTKAANYDVSGFEDGNRVLDIKPIENLFTKIAGNKFTLKETPVNGVIAPGIIQKVDYDSVSLMTSDNTENNGFYFTTIDEKYFYKTIDGRYINISPRSVYSYNEASNRNQNSFDPFIGALDSDSGFVHNIFQMYRKVVEDPNGGLKSGDRMSIIDFLTIAPHLTNAGKDLATFIESLNELSKNDTTEVGVIAKTLMTYVFSPVATRMGDNTDVYTLYQATQEDAFTRTSINHQIIKSLHGALINKANVRYMKVEEGATSITRGLTSGAESEVVNVELAGILNEGVYTKDKIARNIISIAGKPVIKLSDGSSVKLSEVNTIALMDKVAMNVGLTKVFNDIKNKFNEMLPIERSEKGAIDAFGSILMIAAVNKQTAPATLDEADEKKAFEHKNYIRVSPSTLITGENMKVLASLYSVDSHKSTSVGGNLTASTSTPNRDTAIPLQIKEYEHFNKFVNSVKLKFNPFLEDVISTIPRASFDGTVLKTAIVKNGNAIKLADWDVKVRIEHAMKSGFLQGPKNVGREFYIQPVNYSDKSNIELHKILVEGANLLSDDTGVREDLINAYIEYQARKNEDLQRISIHSLKGYVVGNYNTIYDSIRTSADGEARTTALNELRTLLLLDYSETTGDMTRAINNALSIVRIDPDIIMYSDANLDAGADYVTFDGNKLTALLKPHLGVRAALYRDPKKAMKEVISSLDANRSSMDSIGIDPDAIRSLLSKESSTVSDPYEFYDRFYLINGIYGHALKVMTMGDESYFKAKYGKGESIEEYYAAVDSGVRNGLEESEKMLVNQFKRAQSVLTRGNVYSQKITIEGMKRRHNKENLLTYLDIYGDNKVISEGPEGRHVINNEFRFDYLMNKTIPELEGLGVITRFSDGELVHKNSSGHLLLFNLGKDRVVAGNSNQSDILLREAGIPGALVAGINRLVTSVIENTKASNLELVAAHSVLNGPVTEGLAGILKDGVYTGRENALSLDAYLGVIDKINKNNFIVMPDLIPGITVNDPTSYVNLLNSMGNSQENSDAIQYMHPLMSLIMEEARGGSLGAFNTENQEAIKLLTTTFEYDKMRQVLQKKSVQMPFTVEQMKKLGSLELYNTFIKMNTAIEFKKSTMQFNEKIGNRNAATKNYTAKNLQELYEKIIKEQGGYGSSDTLVWRKIVEILRQNPINMFSFVGLITVPSNQKTGHKKFNKFDSIFSKKVNTSAVNIDYTANEYNYEVLTKAHEYDVSGNLHEASAITLLSQLVNATSFGGLSNVTAMNLQNAMAGKMMINRLRVGKDFANIAVKYQSEATNPRSYDEVIDRLRKGDVSVERLSDDEMEVYTKVIRTGISAMAELAFQKSDSVLIQKIIKGEKITVNEAGEAIIEGDSYSLDSPAVRSKVMGTLRASFFKDTVKMKMSGFIGTVSSTYKTINIFTLPNGKRVSRAGFIKGALESGLKEGYGEVINITLDNIIDVRSKILPYDYVQIFDNRGGRMTTTIKHFGDVPNEMLTNPDFKIRGVITPDIINTGSLTQETYSELDDNTMLRINVNGSSKPHFKWYIMENYSADSIAEMVVSGILVKDVTDDYSLRWYEYTNTDGINVKSTKAYRDFYRASVRSNKAEEEEIKGLRASLILELQSKAEVDGKMAPVWEVTQPEVVLPTFMGSAFGIEKGGSLSDILGVDGNDLINATSYFNKQSDIGGRFILLTAQNPHYTEQIKRIYSKKLIVENNTFDAKVLKYLNENENDTLISPAGIKAVNDIILSDRQTHVRGMAEDFISSLEVALTRIPGQSKQSGFMGNVVELLDAQGNATFAATEHLVNTGGDLDIDTLSVLTKTFSKGGRMQRASHFGNVANILKSYENDLTSEVEKMRSLLADYNKKGAEYVINREAKLATQKLGSPKYLEVETQLKNAKKINFDEEQQEQIINKVISKVHNKYEDILSNSIADGVFRSLDDIDTAVELNTPISMGMFDSIIDRIESYTSKIKSANKEVSTISAASSDLISEPVYNEGSVNTMNTKEKKAKFKHFGSPFSAVPTKGLVFVGPNNMSAEELFLPENSQYLQENIDRASEVYRKWLLVKKNTATPIFIGDRSEIDLLNVQPEQRDWIKGQVMSGNLEGAILRVSDNPVMSSHVPELISFINSKGDKSKSGEDYKVIFEYENLAAQGKEAIGIYATVLKINSALQSAKMFYDAHYASSDRVGVDNPFFFESELKYTNFISGDPVEYSRSGFADLDRFEIAQSVARSSKLQKLISSIVNNGKDVNIDSVKTLVNVLSGELKNKMDVNEVDPNSEEMVVAVTALASSLFNIKIPKGTLSTKDVIKSFEAFLVDKPDLVSKAYIEVIGKQLSNDVQSQFLSAATDNAKELILGKIRSNQLTNSVITTMLLLGYDTEAVIDFLYDPKIEEVLDAHALRVSDLEKVSLNESSVKDSGIDTSDPAIQSLMHILNVSDEVTKFRSVRSLNENTQIEQFKLDKIFDKLDADNLYKACLTNNINLIKATNEAQKVFNPNMMVFLHPQSKYLFINLYESEKFKMPVLFNTVNTLRYMTGKESRNMPAYKNASTHLSQSQVEDYLNKAVKYTKADGTEATAIRTGIVMKMDADGTFTPSYVPLNQTANRALFVSQFENYLEYAKDAIYSMSGARNAALDNLGRGNTYNSSNTVWYIPKLKNSNIDSVDISLIHEGISELKIITENNVLNKIQRELYNNLSLYSLIVSGGEIKKGSMTELFEEINLSLAEHLRNKTLAEYMSFVPKNPSILAIVLGEVELESEIIKKSRSKKGGEDMYMAEMQQSVNDEQMEDNELQRLENMGEQEGPTRKPAPKEIRSVYKGKKETANKTFRVQGWQFRDDIFYPYRADEVAYRIFKSENNEALPNTSLPTSVYFNGIPRSFVQELASIGKQIGFSTTYKGKPARILAYSGLNKNVEEYLVSYNSGSNKIAGAFLMAENPDLLLSGNVIQRINSSNIKEAEKKLIINKSVVATTDNMMVPVNNSVTVAVSGLFSDEDITSDPIISKESLVIGKRNGAYDVLKLNNSNTLSNTHSYNVYHSSQDVRKANIGSRRTLIPAIYSAITKSGSVANQPAIDEFMSQVCSMINNTKKGEEPLLLLGISTDISMAKAAPNALIGGIDMLDKLLKPYVTARKDGSISMLKNTFEIERIFDSGSNITGVKITRTKGGTGLVYIDGKVSEVDPKLDPVSGVISSGTWENDQIKLKALEDGLFTAPYLMTKLGVDGVLKDVLVMKVGTESDELELFMVERDRGFNDKYIKIKPSSDKNSIFDSTTKVYNMPKEKYTILLDAAMTKTGYKNNNC